jgi:hypothetical protein
MLTLSLVEATANQRIRAMPDNAPPVSKVAKNPQILQQFPEGDQTQ